MTGGDPASVSVLFIDDASLRTTFGGGSPGYELLHRSPPHICQGDGSPYDLFRLYRLEARCQPGIPPRSGSSGAGAANDG